MKKSGCNSIQHVRYRATNSANFASGVEAGEFVQAHCAETMAEFQGPLLALEQESDILEMDTVCP